MYSSMFVLHFNQSQPEKQLSPTYFKQMLRDRKWWLEFTAIKSCSPSSLEGSELIKVLLLTYLSSPLNHLMVIQLANHGHLDFFIEGPIKNISWVCLEARILEECLLILLLFMYVVFVKVDYVCIYVCTHAFMYTHICQKFLFRNFFQCILICADIDIDNTENTIQLNIVYFPISLHPLNLQGEMA